MVILLLLAINSLASVSFLEKVRVKGTVLYLAWRETLNQHRSMDASIKNNEPLMLV
jgi:hypothetical protein